MKRDDVVLTATAAVSPVGGSAARTCAALRAGIARLGSHPFYFPKSPTPAFEPPELAVVGSVPDGDAGEPAFDRLMKLAVAAAREVLARGRLIRGDLGSTALFISLPGSAGGRPAMASIDAFAAVLVARLGIESAAGVGSRREGTTGMLSLAMDAAARLRVGQVRFALVVGAESYLDDASMTWLDESRRLRSERNVDGFIPGEAATALLLETARDADARGATPLARLLGAAAAREAHTIFSDRFSSGSGLTEAIEGATGLDAGLDAWAVADLNGESYRAQEWGLAQCRLAGRVRLPVATWHPAQGTGDVGAAAGGLQIALAAHAFSRRCAPAANALVWCASDDGTRAACVLGPAGGA